MLFYQNYFLKCYQPLKNEIQETYSRNHVLEGVHDFAGFSFLEVLEAASDDDDRHEHDSQVEIVLRGVLHREVVHGVRDIAQDSSDLEIMYRFRKEETIIKKSGIQ